MIRRLPKPLVHGAWAKAWWEGDPRLNSLFGEAPDLERAKALASELQPPPGWTRALRPVRGKDPVDPQAVIVLAGQQPALGGGPLLVAHKAATAVAYARALQAHLQRPVIPVFLLATQDHDTSEVDHLDLIEPSKGHLKRYRCALEPRNEMFARSCWDNALFQDFLGDMHSIYGVDQSILKAILESKPAPEHVARLLEKAFEGTGLRIVEAHRLGSAAQPILDRALWEATSLAQILEAGESRLRACGFPRSFDPSDPRPLVLESREGRRRRIEASDTEARTRLAARPDDFSPHAALRPIVQAATLPVVAQVCGPSEILYLGQARGLHDAFGVTAPQLIPRLEATVVEADQLMTLDEDLNPPAARSPTDEPLEQLLESLDIFRSTVAKLDQGIAARVDRFAARAVRDAHALAESPEWRGRGGRADARLRPRGRHQDAVLGWLPEAFGPGAHQGWAEHLIALSRPLEPPVHVLHSPPKESS